MGGTADSVNTDPQKVTSLLPPMQGLNLGAGDGAAQQSQLAQMLFNMANGNGPSPAQQMLQQQTQANIANTYAMAQAAGPNNGGAMRNIANQGAALNQQAAGQAALARNQEQLGSTGILSNLLLGSRGQDIQAALGSQGLQQQLAIAQMVNATNRRGQDIGVNQFNQQQDAGILGGVLGAAGTVVGSIYGGPVGGALGGAAGSALGGAVDGATADNGAAGWGQSGGYTPSASLGVNGMAHGGMVGGYAGGGQVSAALPGYCFRAGGQVPGKAQVKGDSPRNDTVTAKLSPGEVVLPRSVVQDKHAEEKAAAFVRELKLKRGAK